MMFAKVSFCVVFVVFISVGQILSQPGKHGDSHSSDGKSTKEHQPKGQKHDHGQGHQHNQGEDPNNAEDNLDVNIRPDSPFMKVKNLSEDLYNEIFVIASGDNYLSPKVSDYVHLNARAIVMLSQTLTRMYSVYQILYNVTTEFALNGAKLEHKQTIIDVLAEVIAQMRRSYSPNMHFQFESIKSGLNDSFINHPHGKYFKKGVTPHERAKGYGKWLSQPFMRTAVLNKLFYRAVWKNDKPPYYKILRAIVSNARYEDEGERLEKLYSDSLLKTVEKISPGHNPRKAFSIFYQNLIDSLSEDPRLFITMYNDREMIPGLMFEEPF